MQNDFRYKSETRLPKIDTKKIAAITAAGPSLDKSAKKIKAAREKYFQAVKDSIGKR